VTIRQRLRSGVERWLGIETASPARWVDKNGNGWCVCGHGTHAEECAVKNCPCLTVRTYQDRTEAELRTLRTQRDAALHFLVEFLGVELELAEAAETIVNRCAHAERAEQEARDALAVPPEVTLVDVVTELVASSNRVDDRCREAEAAAFAARIRAERFELQRDEIVAEMSATRGALLDALCREWGATVSTVSLVKELRASALALPAMLEEFHAGFGQSFGDGGSGNASRIKLHRAEHRELIEALESGDPVAIAHELADNVIVEFGTAHSLGIDLNAVLVLVHRANMTKANAEGVFTLDADGKVVKPADFVPADIASVVTVAGGRP
jgi:NTP pyrophosphatase (non-canonical NTP hydrolase)